MASPGKNRNCANSIAVFKGPTSKGRRGRKHLKYAATLTCNLSLMACFADNNVSQGSVATYAKCCGIFEKHLNANLPGNLLVKKFGKSVNI